MRVLVERVSAAAVTSDGVVTGAIEKGLLVYVGVGPDDSSADADSLADKVRHLRIFPDGEGKMNLDLAAAEGAVLAISAFSLLADAQQGRRPSFTGAARPEHAEPIYERFCATLRGLGVRVETGRFRTMMAVTATNDGPITILLASPARAGCEGS